MRGYAHCPQWIEMARIQLPWGTGDKGKTCMTALILEAKSFVEKAAPRLHALDRRLRQAADDVAAGSTRLVALSLLGMACALSSIALVFSLCIAMPVVTEQFAMWLKSGQWGAVPFATVLTRMGYTPGVDESLNRTIVDWLLSFETGYAIVVAASAFGCAVWIFERVRSRCWVESPA
jgi:hypothetical protein